MNTSIPKHDIPRLLRNLIRIGTVAEVDSVAGTCRVNTVGNVTDWLHWLTSRAVRSCSLWAPSAGEQVLLFCLGGELDTAFVMPGVFSDEFAAPSASADAVHVTFPDGTVIEYEPKIVSEAAVMESDAHFAPDHLKDAIYLNPLAQMVGEKWRQKVRISKTRGN